MDHKITVITMRTLIITIVLVATVTSSADEDTKPVADNPDIVIGDKPDVIGAMHYGAAGFHDNEVPGAAGGGECAILNQVQSVVIQILSTHYEYGKGIHLLHSLVGAIQDDFSALKDQIAALSKQMEGPPEALRTGPDVGRVVQALYSTVGNLTAIVNAQGAHYHSLDKKYSGLRRKVKKVLASGGYKYGTDHGTAEVDHYMRKQTDINAKLLHRITALEQGHQQTQQDAPKTDTWQGCPTGFVRHYSSCYKFVNDTATWIEAEKHCQGYHGDAHLVSIETREEAEYLVQYRLHNKARWTSHYLWTGGTDVSAEGEWRWVGTDATLDYTAWRPGQPDNHAGAQHCVYLRADGGDPRWDDWHCHAARLNYVCEIRAQH